MADDDKPDATGDGGNSDPKITRLPDRRMRERVRTLQRGVNDPAHIRLAKARHRIGQDCPYEPLGRGEDGVCWIIEASGNVRGMRARDLNRTGLVVICGNETWLEKKYPRTRQGKPVEGFAAEKAVNDLIDACSVMGEWSPDQRLRGVGAWKGEDDDLILHRGDKLIVRGVVQGTGRHGEFVYVPDKSLPALPPPGEAGEATAGQELLNRLDSFPWQRGSFDSMILFGWMCAAIIGGALTFRPHAWVTGEYGVGKSTLQLLLSTVFGAAGIVSVTDATEAGLRQSIGYRTVPIGCDELEATDDSSRPGSLIRFIRQASTTGGGYILRGGMSHQAAAFSVQSAFLCSSIIVPPMPSQDLSRFVVLQLVPREAHGHRAPFDLDRLERIGANLTRRLAARFGYLTKEAMPQFRQLMKDRGYPDRGADLFSCLFACAAVALYDDVAHMNFARMLDGHQMGKLLAEMLAEQTPEWRRCLDYLQTTRIDRQRAESDTYGELIERAMRPLFEPSRYLSQGQLFDANSGAELLPDDEDGRASKARERLLHFGLRVTVIRGEDGNAVPALYVANQHRQLAEIFEKSVWRTLPEAAGGGGWSQVLRRAPGAVSPQNPVRFRAGILSRALLIPAALLLQPGASPTDSKTAAAADAPAARAWH